LVKSADIVFDTIDFLSLQGLLALHDECRRQSKPLLSALSLGWGAGLLYFPPDCSMTLRRLFNLPADHEPVGAEHLRCFAPLLEKLAWNLDPQVLKALSRTFSSMENGTPCSAPQVSAGAAAVASLGITAIIRVLAGEKVVAAPQLIMADFAGICAGPGISLIS